jgi:phosphopantetheinyl transferase
MSEQVWSSPKQVPPLSFEAVQVWWFDLNHARLRQVLLYAESVMSASERARDRQFLTLRGSESFRCGRGLLRLLLGQALGIAGQDVRILISENGKPYLEHEAQIHFSLSHSSSTLLVALSNAAEVGIDVEDQAADSLNGEDLKSLAVEHFEPGEARLVCSASTYEERLRAFLLVWTAREALGKAAGIGIVKPDSIGSASPARSDAEAARVWTAIGADGASRPYWLLPLHGIDGCIGSLALQQDIRVVRRFRAEALFGQDHINA